MPYEAMQPDDVTAIDLDELMRAIERCAGARVKDDVKVIVRANAPEGPPSYGATVADAGGVRTFRATGVVPDVLAWLLDNHDPAAPAAILELAWMVGDKAMTITAIAKRDALKGRTT